jgi:hypothetical protein
MRKALVALDSLEGGPGPWTFGGGTALALILGHRVSYDVYIFLDSSTVMKTLAPNINPVTKSLCDAWQWPGKYLKLILRDVGEIDFLNAPSYIEDPRQLISKGSSQHVVMQTVCGFEAGHRRQFCGDVPPLIGQTPVSSAAKTSLCWQTLAKTVGPYHPALCF